MGFLRFGEIWIRVERGAFVQGWHTNWHTRFQHLNEYQVMLSRIASRIAHKLTPSPQKKHSKVLIVAVNGTYTLRKTAATD